MKVVALVSGGKDSCYNMLLCRKHGHEIVALANLLPAEEGVDELDSFCFQTVGHNVVAAYAACCGLPLFRRRFDGVAKAQGLAYSATEGDEVEDLWALLSAVKARIPGVQAVSSGAIASDYQRLRVEDVCSRLGLVSLAYMWHQPQEKLLREMCASGIEAVLIKVAALGLEPRKHLGKTLPEMESTLKRLRGLYDVNVCGEGGEYETLTLDCPLFTCGRIRLDETEVVMHAEGDDSQGGTLRIGAFHVEPKAPGSLGEAEIIDVAGDAAVLTADKGAETSGAASPLPSGVRAVAEVLTRSQGFVHLLCRLWCPGPVAEGASAASAYESFFEAAGEALAGEQLEWGDALFCNLYLNSIGLFGPVNAVYNRYVTQVCPPARACVELPLPEGQVLHLDVLLRRRGPALPPRTTLHVQSVSEWAPPCIGPYSQGVSTGGLVFMAGQISLDPPSLAIVPSGLQGEVRQALNNCEAAAVALRTSVKKSLLAMTSVISERAGHSAGVVVGGELMAFGVAEDCSSDEDEDSWRFDVLCSEPRAPTSRTKWHLDAYIRPPAFQEPEWDFLQMYAAVPRLPKDALIEFLPLTVTGDGELRDALCSGFRGPHGNPTSAAALQGLWTTEWVGAPRMALVARMFLSAEALDKKLLEAGRESCLDALADEAAAAADEALKNHQMGWRHVSGLRVYAASPPKDAALGPSPEGALLESDVIPRLAARATALMKAEANESKATGTPAACCCSPVWVPVVRVGRSQLMQDALAVELVAADLEALL